MILKMLFFPLYLDQLIFIENMTQQMQERHLLVLDFKTFCQF